MNDTLHTAPPLQPLFERLALKSHELVSTTAEQRAEKIRRLLKSVMDARPQILEAGRKELKLQDMDIDMQLLMVKTECEFVARNLGKWMGRHPVKGSLMSLGKKATCSTSPKAWCLISPPGTRPSPLAWCRCWAPSPPATPACSSLLSWRHCRRRFWPKSSPRPSRPTSLR